MTAPVDATWPTLRARHETDSRQQVGRVLRAVADDVRARHEAGAATLLSATWDRRLAAVILDRNRATATDFGARTASKINPRRAADDFDPSAMESWLTRSAERSAANINDTTRADLEGDDVDVDVALDRMLHQRLAVIASAMVLTAANFGAQDGARAAGADTKVWTVNSGNPRSSHAAMSGAATPIDSRFSNGMRWPGDPAGGVDQIAGCMCSLTFI